MFHVALSLVEKRALIYALEDSIGCIAYLANQMGENSGPARDLPKYKDLLVKIKELKETPDGADRASEGKTEQGDEGK